MFLSFGMFNTHRKYPENDTFNPNYVVPPFPVADTHENRVDFANYMKSVSIVDECAGRVIEAVKEKGIWDNTIIVFTTDHGLPLPSMKCNLFDTGIGVSLIMAGGMLPKGACRNQLISQVDLFPTFCEWLGIPTPDWCVGYNAEGLIYHDAAIRDMVFAEVNYHTTYQPMRAVRTGKYKLIKAYYDTSIDCYVNIDNSPAKEYLVKPSQYHRKLDPVMLFDLECDPMERQNLAEEPAYQEICNTMLHSLETWMKETDDPLLMYEKVPCPENAVVEEMTAIYKSKF